MDSSVRLNSPLSNTCFRKLISFSFNSNSAIPQIWGVGWYLNSVNTTSGVYGNVTIGSGGEYRGPPSATTTAVIPTTTVAPQTIGPIFSTPSGLGSLVPASTATIVVVTPTPSSAGSKLGLTSVWLSLMGLVVGGIIV